MANEQKRQNIWTTKKLKYSSLTPARIIAYKSTCLKFTRFIATVVRCKHFEYCDITRADMRLLYNKSKRCKIKLKDRTKDQMIGRLIKRECNRTSSARPFLHILLRLLLRVRGGIYNARFRRSSVKMVEFKRRYRPRKHQKQQPNKGQLWPETDMVVQCILYKKLLAPFYFRLFRSFCQ